MDTERFRVWEDDLWRLEAGSETPTTAVFLLGPKRHIPHIAELDGDEATTFGRVLAHTSQALREATGARHVTVYIPGDDAPGLCVHLIPQVDVPRDELREIAERARSRLAQHPPPWPDQPQQPLLPFPRPPQPRPLRRPGEESDPEIPPPWREPPLESWPDCPAHDPWFSGRHNM